MSITFPPLGTPLRAFSLAHLKEVDYTCFPDNSVVQSTYDYIGMYGIVSVTDPSWQVPQPYFNHHGLDSQSHALNTPIYSINDGTVVSVGGAYNSVVIHATGTDYYYYYLHLNTTNVSVGQKVSRGTHIGGEGTTGAEAIHLHLAKMNYMTGVYYDVLDEQISGSINPPEPTKKQSLWFLDIWN